MHLIDMGIFIAYMLAMLGVGYYFMKKNSSQEDYYVGGRSIGSWHIGLSVVATDVGGGFSIGLGDQNGQWCCRTTCRSGQSCS